MSSRPVRKKTVSITLDTDLAERARQAGVNMSRVSAEAIMKAIEEQEKRKIATGIRQDMDWYAELIAKHGCPAEAARAHFEAGDEPI